MDRAGPVGGRGGLLPCPGHLHLLRHRQQQPDPYGSHGPAAPRRILCQPGNAPARGTGSRERRAHRATDRPGCRPATADGRRRRALLRQRHGGAARLRRLHQPRDAPGCHGPRCGADYQLGRFQHPVGNRTATGPGLSERPGRHQSLPCRRRHRASVPGAARRGPHARNGGHGLGPGFQRLRARALPGGTTPSPGGPRRGRAWTRQSWRAPRRPSTTRAGCACSRATSVAP